METNEELRQQMWELAYGLLSPEEVASLHARIKSDPAAARLYAEVRLQADLVADAAKVSDPSVQFHVDGETSLPRPTPAHRGAASHAAARKSSSQGVNWLVGLAGMALAALLCLAFFRPATSNALLAERFVATSVEAPSRWQTGLPQEVVVYTTDIDQVGKPAEVEVRLVDATGEERLRRSVRTDERGRGAVDLLCESLEGEVRLEVTAQAEEGASAGRQQADVKTPVVLDVKAIPEPVEAYVVLDKPAYQAGETVNFAVRKVTRFSKQLVAGDPLSTAASGMGSETPSDFLAAAPVGEGVEAGQIQLPASGTLGRLAAVPEGKLQQSPGGGEEPQFYYFDQVASALPQLSKLQAPGAEAAEMRFGTPAPADLARVDDALASSRGGVGPPRPDQSSADAVKANGGAIGGAVLEAEDVPATASYRRAGASAGATAGGRNVVAAGQPIEVPLPTDSGQQLLVTARCNDRVVASKKIAMTTDSRSLRAKQTDEAAATPDAIAPAQQASIAELNPPAEVDGEILVSIYDSQQQPPQLIAHQHYFRQPQQRLEIRLPDLQDHYTAGDRVKLQVQVMDEQSRPVDASLAVRVWNEQVIQAAEAPVADLASAVLSGNESLARDASSLGIAALSNAAGRRQGFGGQAGASGPGEADAAADAKASASGALALHADMDALYKASESDILLSYAGPVRLEASNFTEVKAAYDSAAAQARQQATERKATIGRLLLIGGGALLVLLVMQALLRAAAKTSVWLPTVAIAAASLVLGAVWLNPRFEPGDAVQTASVPAEPAAESASEMAPADDAAGALPAGPNAPNANPAKSERLLERAAPSGSDGKDGSEAPARLRAPAAMEPLEKEAAERFDAQTGQPSPLDGAAAPVAPAPAGMPPASDATPSASAAADRVNRNEVPQLKSAQPTNEPSASSSDEADAMPLADQPAPARVLGDRSRQTRPAEPGSRAMRRLATREMESSNGDGKNAPAQAGDAPAPPPTASAAADEPQAKVRGGAAGASPAAPAPGMRRSYGPTASSGDKLARVAEQQPPSENLGRAAVAAKKLDKAEESVDSEREEANKREANFRQSRAAQRSESKELAASAIETPASLLFEPALSTDSNGLATVEFTLPEVDCEYRVLIDAIGHGRIGSLQQVIVGRAKPANKE